MRASCQTAVESRSRHIDVNEQGTVRIQHQTAVVIARHDGVERLNAHEIADRLFIDPFDLG